MAAEADLGKPTDIHLSPPSTLKTCTLSQIQVKTGNPTRTDSYRRLMYVHGRNKWTLTDFERFSIKSISLNVSILCEPRPMGKYNFSLQTKTTGLYIYQLQILILLSKNPKY